MFFCPFVASVVFLCITRDFPLRGMWYDILLYYVMLCYDIHYSSYHYYQKGLSFKVWNDHPRLGAEGPVFQDSSKGVQWRQGVVVYIIL